MTRLLLALALLAVTARLLRRRHPAPLRSLTSSAQAPDDSEVVGMPTTWLVGDYGPETFSSADPLGPGWYVELAPTSRN